MEVATYRWTAGYAGKQVQILCRSCGQRVVDARKQSTFGHAELWATCDEDWHAGECASHAAGQRLLDRVERNHEHEEGQA